ncbi:MAG: hypothetical protein ACE5H4_15345 [Candidatus Thorarchaeota archaeon]
MKQGKSILVAAVLLLSFAWAFSSASIATAQVTPDPILAVGWQVVNQTEDISHHEEHSEWLFGPQPVVWIGYATGWVWNGTKISENNYRVDPGDQILVNITVPWEFIEAGFVLDSVAFWGELRGVRYAAFGMEYNITADAWNHLSVTYQEGVDATAVSGFMTLHTAYCSYFNDTSDRSYKLEFAITFSNVWTGVFKTGMHAKDTEGRPVSPSWLARVESGAFETPPIGIGVEVPPEVFRLPRYYYAEIIDGAGDILHYVDIDDPFTFRMVSNYPFGEVIVPFSVLTWDRDYIYNYNWTIKTNLWNRNSINLTIIGMPLFLFFQYNSTGQYAVAGHLDNVTWSWIPIVGVWTVSFDILLVYDADLARFYNLLDRSKSMGGSEVYWTGSYTQFVDMNMEEYVEGDIVKPVPYFWTVRDTSGRDLTPRREIENKNTVQMAFRDTFIEAFIKNPSGDIVERAMPNQILNITLDVHVQGSLVNDTTAILVNETNVYNPETGQFYDIDSYYVTRTLQNFTMSFVGYGSGHNDTHTWEYIVVHIVRIDFIAQNMTDLSVVYTEYMPATEVAAASPLNSKVNSTTMVESLDWNITIGPDLTTLQLSVNVTAEADPAVYNQVYTQAGFWEDFAVNASLAGANNYMLTPLPGESRSVVDETKEEIIWSPARLVFGDIPIWEEPLWTVTEEGALDLDGNMFTTEDQYYVKRTGTWDHWGNNTIEGMGVKVIFDPTPNRNGDEFWSESWMGVVRTLIEYQATENFFWHRASDWSRVNQTDMNDILDTLWADVGEEIPAPGYEWIAWISLNRTNIHTTIPELESGVWRNTWFAWGTQQTFRVSATENRREFARFRARYAGLLLFNDIQEGGAVDAPDFRIVEGQVVTDEVTHFVLIDTVDSVELRRPFGATNDSGLVAVPVDTPVTFGVTIYGVNVTLYPLQIRDADGIRGAWDYRESYEAQSSLTASEFDYYISKATVTEMAFDISFNVDMVEYDALDPAKWNHAVAFKVDQKFGDWTLHTFDNSVLTNRSLAVNFFGILGTGTKMQYNAAEAPVADTNGATVEASYYEYGADDTPFANVTMGGLPYTTGKDGFAGTYTSGSSTVPIGAFSVMYQSASGETVTDWQVEASMLFMTAGYTEWDGHEIRCDPVFVSFSSAFQSQQTTTTTTTTTTTITPPEGDGQMALYIMVGAAVVLVVLVLVLMRRR